MISNERPGAALTFFNRIFDHSRELISTFPLTTEPAAMDYISGILEDAVRSGRRSSPFSNPDVEVAKAQRSNAGGPVGLNTVGLLLDRMSILAVKAWNLEYRANAPEKAEELRASQVAELVEALASSRPGHSSVNNKLTSHRTDVEAVDFAAACYNLVTTNLLLWEAQEILYNHDIASLPSDELRKYIQFFSTHNLSRNVSIEAIDRLYWTAVEVN